MPTSGVRVEGFGEFLHDAGSFLKVITACVVPPEVAYAAFEDTYDKILAYAEDAAILPHPAPRETPGAIVLMVLVAGIVALAVSGRRRR